MRFAALLTLVFLALAAPAAASGDADFDGVPDGSDNCPAVYNPSQTDSDFDLAGDACDDDIDGDGSANAADAFPLDPSEQVDTDGDGIGDNADTDGDGYADSVDALPDDRTEHVDSDGDGVGDNAAPDDDNDGVPDPADNCPTTSNASQANYDGDLLGDACDADDDNDGFPDAIDALPR